MPTTTNDKMQAVAATRPELLIIVVDRNGVRLHDCANHHIGWFNTVAEAEVYCRDNGYRWRVQQ